MQPLSLCLAGVVHPEPIIPNLLMVMRYPRISDGAVGLHGSSELHFCVYVLSKMVAGAMPPPVHRETSP